MVTSKYLIKRHKDNVHTALKDLEYAVNKCSKETPRTVAKKVISDYIKQFEEKCGCNRRS